MCSKIMKKTIKKSQFMELFLSLIESGFSITGSLKILSEKVETKEYALKIRKDIENNGSVSKALLGLSDKLSVYESILSTAEETGDIAPALKGVVEDLKENEEEKRNLFIVLVYPVVVGLIAISMSLFLIELGIPYINLIADVDRNECIQVIVGANLWLLFSGIVILFISIYLRQKYEFQKSLFKNLYYLNMNSVGMEDSFQILLRQKKCRKKDLQCLSFILSGLRNGELFFRLCEKTGRFDIFAVSWLFVMEEDGDVSEGLRKIFENYKKMQKEIRESLHRFLEPVILAVTGIYVLILIAGCVIPVFMTLGSKII